MNITGSRVNFSLVFNRGLPQIERPNHPKIRILFLESFPARINPQITEQVKKNIFQKQRKYIKKMVVGKQNVLNQKRKKNLKQQSSTPKLNNDEVFLESEFY